MWNKKLLLYQTICALLLMIYIILYKGNIIVQCIVFILEYMKIFISEVLMWKIIKKVEKEKVRTQRIFWRYLFYVTHWVVWWSNSILTETLTLHFAKLWPGENELKTGAIKLSASSWFGYDHWSMSSERFIGRVEAGGSSGVHLQPAAGVEQLSSEFSDPWSKSG